MRISDWSSDVCSSDLEDYDNWLARANRMPGLFDTAIDNMRQGMEAGVVQPRALMEKVVPQLDALIKDKAEDTLLWGPIKSMPGRSEEHTSELQSLMRISYAVVCLKKKNTHKMN